MKITVLDCPKSKSGRYHLVYGLSAWPKGTRHNRGWANARVIYSRQATQEEVDEQEACMRHLCWQYKDWDLLVADEAKYGVDANLARDRYYPDLALELEKAAARNAADESNPSNTV